MLELGDLVRIRVESISQNGDGIAYHGDSEIHVRGLFPGEIAEVAIEHRSQHRPWIHASVRSRISDHPGRRPAPCPHHGDCNGCVLMDIDVRSQRELKLEALRGTHGLPVDDIVGEAPEDLPYRCSSKRIVGGVRGDVRLGSYRRGTHELADMDGCRVDHPSIVAGTLELRSAINELALEPYDEVLGRGDLRYVWLKANREGDLLLTLITAEPCSRAAKELADRLKLPIGVAWGVQSTTGNALRGATVRPLRGRQSLSLDIADVEVEAGPLGFMQPNPVVAGMAYRDLVRMPAGGWTRGRFALDLYAGAGITTALLRRHFEQVAPCEAYPESARALGVEPELAESFLARVVAASGAGRRAVDLVVANPPRGGLGPIICGQLNRLGAARLHIMSCYPSSLADDLRRLTGTDGAYRLLRTRAYDTLPQTAHIEIVAWLVASGG
jgi:23S rRNA (uracil1939-C5)-methyltransferase